MHGSHTTPQTRNVPVSQPGNFPDSSVNADYRRTLGIELQRLRKAGLSDLALRPRRYPALNEIVTAGGAMPADTVSRLRHNERVFAVVLEELPTPAMRTAAGLLFHAGGGTPPPLDDRRRMADRAYTGHAYAREPDTVQRHLERAVLDPLLLDILQKLDPAKDNRGLAAQVNADVDYGAWADDLERALLLLNRQDFRAMGILLDRWIGRVPPGRLADHGLYLRGRSLMLLGDMRRYQAHLVGPLSARESYRQATSVFHGLGNARRLAQVELSEAITTEMAGQLDAAATMYRRLADDERLRDYERSQALLWVGTALTKSGDVGPALQAIETASQQFEEQAEPDDWGVAQQKHALAYLAAGDLANATRAIDTALTYRHEDSPLEQVRLDTAHGHVLVMDKRTVDQGQRVLARARHQAARHGLAHQLSWIDKIAHLPEHPARRLS